MKPCPLDLCDGSGMRDIYFLKTVERHPGGSVFTRNEPITRETYKALEPKLADSKTQSVYTAAKACACRTEAVGAKKK